MYIKPSFPRRRESSKTIAPQSGQCQGAVSLREVYPIHWIPACAGMTRQSGISLIELIMFIVIVSVALAGIMLGMNQITGHSADTLLRKQALTVAESVLEQIEAQQFSNITPTNIALVVNNVMSASGLSGYNASAGLDTTSGLGVIAGTHAVVITVTVTDPSGQAISLTGYRTSYY